MKNYEKLKDQWEKTGQKWEAIEKDAKLLLRQKGEDYKLNFRLSFVKDKFLSGPFANDIIKAEIDSIVPYMMLSIECLQAEMRKIKGV